MNSADTATAPTPSFSAKPALPSRRRRLGIGDWIFAALVAAGLVVTLSRYGASMDGYEIAITLGAAAAMTWLGWSFKPLRVWLVLVALASLIGIASYGGDLARADQAFFLKYLFASQSAILWMCALFVLSTLFYWIGLLGGARGFAVTAAQMGSWFLWAAVGMGLTGLMMRWYESHQMGPGIGHIPVSNLYEVFVLFCLITSLFYLHYERRYATRSLGAFVMLVVTGATGFLLWYSFDRGAHEIQPLVPALQSWWMKIHVPANFIGYGTFSLAAMVAYAYLVQEQTRKGSSTAGLARLWMAGTALFLMFIAPMMMHGQPDALRWTGYLVGCAALSAAIVAVRRPIAERLPAPDVLDDVMYKAIAVGFAFFTIATILGALWAAEAWGAYWQWDPKETWALIVWLNYAAWLHLRLVKGLRGTLAAYWALVGLLVTGFAFLGVNMFLSGLHSYGTL
ncbi:c-type cytochrome biogenesis protein CcsB [soil metagenome]